MNKEELFEKLHIVFTGIEGKKNSTILEYENLSVDEGLEKAEKYLAWAKMRQDNCQSDWAYWAYEGDKTLAMVLMNIFKALKQGIQEFPEIPDLEGKMLMDKLAYLEDWSYSIGMLNLKEGVKP